MLINCEEPIDSIYIITENPFFKTHCRRDKMEIKMEETKFSSEGSFVVRRPETIMCTEHKILTSS